MHGHKLSTDCRGTFMYFLILLGCKSDSGRPLCAVSFRNEDKQTSQFAFAHECHGHLHGSGRRPSQGSLRSPLFHTSLHKGPQTPTGQSPASPENQTVCMKWQGGQPERKLRRLAQNGRCVASCCQLPQLATPPGGDALQTRAHCSHCMQLPRVL